MWWIYSLLFLAILFVLLFALLVGPSSDIVLVKIIVDLIDKFQATDPVQEDKEKYLEKKQRQMEKHTENIIEAYKNNPIVHYQESRIVSINKPIGKWTYLITMAKLRYIDNMKKAMNGRFSKKMGFWQTTVKAQARSESRERGRGR